MQTIQLTGSAVSGFYSQHAAKAALMPTTVCLGRIKPQSYAPALKLSHFLPTPGVSAPPPTITNWQAKAASVLSRMYLNDRYGDYAAQSGEDFDKPKMIAAIEKLGQATTPEEINEFKLLNQ